MASDSFVIKGARPLIGAVEVSGSKNAALAIIAATLLTKEPCVLENVPAIEDVRRLLEMLESLGGRIEWLEPHTVKIINRDVEPKRLDQALVGRLRASVLCLGPLLARTGVAFIAHPGGCLIGARPVATHVAALTALGARVKETPDAYTFAASRLRGGEVVLREFSVTATENTLMAAVRARGRTTIRIAAAEPHVVDLARFLTKMGARIRGAGTHEIEVEGVSRLQGARHRVISDPIEAMTFAVALAATRGRGAIRGADPSVLDLPLLKLREAGVPIKIKNQKSKIKNNLSNLVVKPALKLTAVGQPGIQTMPYPGFPTDLQAPFSVLATQCTGATLIHETLYEGRLKHVEELAKMGANVVIMDPHRALVIGPTALYGTEIRSLDLRAGATLVIAALVAEGESVIHDAYTIDRGYERLEEKLTRLGADIRRIPADL